MTKVIASRFICFVLLAGEIFAIQTAKKTSAASVPQYTYKIVKVYPHDPEAYTQGLVYKDGFLYEGTGLNGRSSLRKVRLDSGEVLQKVELPPELFGEGITLLGGKIFNSPGKQARDLFTTLAIFVCCASIPIRAKGGA